MLGARCSGSLAQPFRRTGTTHRGRPSVTDLGLADVRFQVDLEALRELTWSGCPPPLRADCWRLLLGYLPPSHDRRCVQTAARPPCCRQPSVLPLLQGAIRCWSAVTPLLWQEIFVAGPELRISCFTFIGCDDCCPPHVRLC